MDTTSQIAFDRNNYDADRDADEGLTIAKGGTGAGETNFTKYQNWRNTTAFSENFHIQGDVEVQLWAASKTFQLNRRGEVNVFLRDWDGTSSYTEIANATLFEEDWQAGFADFVFAEITVATVDYTIPAGHYLEVKVLVGSATQTPSMWFMYDYVDFESKVFVPELIDDDGDGIQNEIDGQFSGSFTDESGVFSDNFTDEHLGGTTSGSITDRGGLTVGITDAGDASDGVVLAATGESGTATVDACSTTFTLTPDDFVTVTCGSAIFDVLTGPIQVQLTPDTTAEIPTGAKATVSEIGVEEHRIEIPDPSQPPVTVNLNGCTGSTLSVPKGAIVEVRVPLAGTAR